MSDLRLGDSKEMQASLTMRGWTDRLDPNLLDSARGVSAQLASAQRGRLSLAVFGSARLDRLGSARLGPARARPNSARLCSARVGSARPGSAQLGSARLGLARSGSARSAWLGWVYNNNRESGKLRLWPSSWTMARGKMAGPCTGSRTVQPGSKDGL